MKILKYCEIQLTWIGVGFRRLNDPTNEFMESPAFYIFMFGFVGFTFVSSTTYAYIHANGISNMTGPL